MQEQLLHVIEILFVRIVPVAATTMIGHLGKTMIQHLDKSATRTKHLITVVCEKTQTIIKRGACDNAVQHALRGFRLCETMKTVG